MIKINITYLKILDSINDLNEKSYFPSIKGIEKYINGIIDEDTKKFINNQTFSCLLSLKGRRLASKIHQLIRYKYLEYKLNKEDKSLYLKISLLGLKTLNEKKKENKINYKQKKTIKKLKKEIVKID